MSVLQSTGSRPVARGTVTILLLGMLMTAAVRGFAAAGSLFVVPPVFGMFDVAVGDLLSPRDEYTGALWLLDWGLTACGVLASVFVVVRLTIRPDRLRRTTHVLAWAMAVDAVVYLASWAIVWPSWLPPASWDSGDWWVAAAITAGSLCTFWTAVVVVRRTALRGAVAR